MEALPLLLVLTAATAVAVDASRLDAHRGRLGGRFLDMGPAAWFFCVLLVWVVSLPAYLVVRPKLVRVAGAAPASVLPVTAAPARFAAPLPPAVGAAAHGGGPRAHGSHPLATVVEDRFAPSPSSAHGPHRPPGASPTRAERLEHLRRLHESGQVGDSEFRQARRRILADPA